MYYIYDCNGEVIGNPKGYRTFRGANQQANSRRSKVYPKIWATYEKRKALEPTFNLIMSIEYEEVRA
jgi:hypothetical protein